MKGEAAKGNKKMGAEGERDETCCDKHGLSAVHERKDDDQEATSSIDTRSKVSLKGKTIEELIIEYPRDDNNDKNSGSSEVSEVTHTTSANQSHRMAINVVDEEGVYDYCIKQWMRALR